MVIGLELLECLVLIPSIGHQPAFHFLSDLGWDYDDSLAMSGRLGLSSSLSLSVSSLLLMLELSSSSDEISLGLSCRKDAYSACLSLLLLRRLLLRMLAGLPLWLARKRKRGMFLGVPRSRPCRGRVVVSSGAVLGWVDNTVAGCFWADTGLALAE